MFFTYLHFFLSFQLILFTLCQVFRHHLKYFHNFTNLKQEQKPSHFVLSYLWQQWGYIHKAFWNGLSIIGISAELGNVLVMVLEKKRDKKGAEICRLAACYLCKWTRGCGVWSKRRQIVKQNFPLQNIFLYHGYHTRFKIAATLCLLKWNPCFSFYFWTSGLTKGESFTSLNCSFNTVSTILQLLLHINLSLQRRPPTINKHLTAWCK